MNLYLSAGLKVVSGWKGSVLYPSNSYILLLQVGLGFRQRLGGQEGDWRHCQQSDPPSEPAGKIRARGEGGQAAVGEGGDCTAGGETERGAKGQVSLVLPWLQAALGPAAGPASLPTGLLSLPLFLILLPFPQSLSQFAVSASPSLSVSASVSVFIAAS